MMRVCPERTWLDYAMLREVQPVIFADNRNDYRLLGAYDYGDTYEVRRNRSRYVTLSKALWNSPLNGPHPSKLATQEVRATFHATPESISLTGQNNRIPPDVVAHELFLGLTWPVYNAASAAIRELREIHAKVFNYSDIWTLMPPLEREAQEIHALLESDHWYMFAPRHAQPVMRYNHLTDTYTMQLEWATLEADNYSGRSNA